MSGEEHEDAGIIDEVDGDLEVLRSSDSRYIELRLYSNHEISAEAFMAVLEAITMRFGPDPDKLFESFGRKLPGRFDMN